MPSRFCFTGAAVYTNDCNKSAIDIADKEGVNVSDESCWILLEQCLIKVPIKQTYEMLDELYGSHELCFPEGSEFSVESIRGRSINKGIVYYFVKWEGWPPIFNTWEPECNLVGCETAIKRFDEKCGSGVGMLQSESTVAKRTQVKEILDRLREAVPCSTTTPFQLLARFLKLLPVSSGVPRPYKQMASCTTDIILSTQIQTAIRHGPKLKRAASDASFPSLPRKRIRMTQKEKETLTAALERFQQKLNKVYPNEAPITVLNTVDLECPPEDFQPISDYHPGHGVFLPTKAPVGCECSLAPIESATNAPLEPCWVNRKNGCCAVRAGAGYPYNRYKRLLVPNGHPVYECNSQCPCTSTCPFRVVQLGRKVPLCVFRTRDRGWGVKTKAPIGKGTFVAEYLGEILTFDEAEQRGIIYDKQTMTYLFDLDFEGDAHFTVDASQMGNISHFFNHSCDPNLTVRCVFIECLDTKLPRIALFANRLIRKDEELTFDYNMTGAITNDEGATAASEDEPSTSAPVPSTSTSERKSPPFSVASTDIVADSASEISSDYKSLLLKGPRMKCLCRSKNCRGYLVA